MPVEIYVCRGCDHRDTKKWKGKCPACGVPWTVTTKRASENEHPDGIHAEVEAGEVVSLSDVSDDAGAVERILVGGKFGAVDILFGGDPEHGGEPGIAEGSIILLAGSAGVGKSTLLLQLLQSLSRRMRVLYVSAEESLKQLAMRSKRIGKFNKKLLVVKENDLDLILDKADEMRPQLVVIDSIQRLAVDEDLRPGSVATVSEALLIIEEHSRNTGTTYLLVGHVDKAGEIAGPNSGLVHAVDVVLEFSGDPNLAPRFLKCPSKNRFGPSGPLCVVQFEMRKKGLVVIEPTEAAPTPPAPPEPPPPKPKAKAKAKPQPPLKGKPKLSVVPPPTT